MAVEFRCGPSELSDTKAAIDLWLRCTVLVEVDKLDRHLRLPPNVGTAQKLVALGVCDDFRLGSGLWFLPKRAITSQALRFDSRLGKARSLPEECSPCVQRSHHEDSNAAERKDSS